MVSAIRNEALGIDICAFLSKMTDSKWPPLFVYNMIFPDIIKNKKVRDKILVSLSMFLRARKTVAVSIYKLNH